MRTSFEAVSRLSRLVWLVQHTKNEDTVHYDMGMTVVELQLTVGELLLIGTGAIVYW